MLNYNTSCQYIWNDVGVERERIMRVQITGRRIIGLTTTVALLLGSAVAVQTASAEEGGSMPASIVDNDPAVRQDQVQTLSVQPRSSAEKTSVLGVTLGSGTTVYTTVTLNQKDVRAKALSEVVKWRRDALRDTRIKMPYNAGAGGSAKYVSMAQYLKLMGISQQQYLSPKWSNALERIATQRAIESADYQLGHVRPNGWVCFSAEYGDDSSWAEVLAWGSPDIAGAIGQWAAEKSEYVKEVNGKDHGVTGHYVQLIDPAYQWYGFGQGESPQWGTSFAGEASTNVNNQSQAATNWTGHKTVEVNVTDELLNQGVYSNIPSSLTVGRKIAAVAKLRYLSGHYQFRGAWSSTSPAILSVSNGNVITAKKAGEAAIRVSGQGKSFSFKVRVTNASKVPVYRVYNRRSGLHHYTTNAAEKNMLVAKGWRYEGVSFNAARGGSGLKPVYREYNRRNGNHNWTMNKREHDMLVHLGWRNEGIAWYVLPSAPTTVYRLYNPNSGEHVYTTNYYEYQLVGSRGWRREGVAWKSL